MVEVCLRTLFTAAKFWFQYSLSTWGHLSLGFCAMKHARTSLIIVSVQLWTFVGIDKLGLLFTLNIFFSVFARLSQTDICHTVILCLSALRHSLVAHIKSRIFEFFFFYGHRKQYLCSIYLISIVVHSYTDQHCNICSVITTYPHNFYDVLGTCLLPLTYIFFQRDFLNFTPDS